MYLSTVEIENFRSLKKLRADFQSGLNVLVGRNNTGKTNLVVTVPERLGRILTQGGEIRLLPLPFPMHSIEIRQYWHRRYDNDAGNRWLRDTIRQFFGDAAVAH